MFGRAELVRDFQQLGVRAGDLVMLHASVRAVGEIAGGPDEIHLALKEVLTTAGTLVMYASCPRYVDEVGRGHLSAEREAEILEKLPPFDARTARASRDNGALVELFRTWPDSRVNDHPARFVVWGALADHLLSLQPWDYAFGAGSLLERFVQADGRILLLGSDHDTVTFLHYAEHILDAPGKRIARFVVPILENGVRVWRPMVEVDTSDRGAHPNWPDRFFATLVDACLAEAGNGGARVGEAESYYLSARELLRYALPVMRSVALGLQPPALRSVAPLPRPAPVRSR